MEPVIGVDVAKGSSVVQAFWNRKRAIWQSCRHCAWNEWI